MWPLFLYLSSFQKLPVYIYIYICLYVNIYIYTLRRWTPHPVIVAIMDNDEYIRVLLYSHYTTITGWGGPHDIYIPT